MLMTLNNTMAHGTSYQLNPYQGIDKFLVQTV